jgi:hypothetical protein
MKYILIFLVLLLSGCSVKEYHNSQPKLIIIKSPKLKFADIGYLRNNEDAIELELFSAGTAIEKITINHFICVSDGCMSKGSFNDEYLYHIYPNDILQNIMLSKPIYESKNKIEKNGGFYQLIKDADVDIIYTVTKDMTYFKDKRNKIIFKMKDIK